MPKPTFYIDLDRTLFHTDKAGEIFAALASAYPDNARIAEGYDQRGEYYVFPHDGDDVTYYHDIVAQLREAGVDCAEAFSRIRPQLSDSRFEYPGAEHLMAVLQARGTVKILTYGEDTYQRFKVELCPSLAGVEVIAIIESKTAYLNMHAGPKDWIIDDKLMTGIVNGMHVVRVQHARDVEADAHSLNEVAALVEQTEPAQQG